MNTSDFNSKISELENKIKVAEQKPNISNLATISSVTAVWNKIPTATGFVRKIDYATEIGNNYVTTTALTSQLNDLKSQHIADEVKKVDNKVKKNISDTLRFKSRLKQKEDTLNDLEREASFFRGSYYFNQQSYLIYEPKTFSFKQTAAGITHWKSTGIKNYLLTVDLRSVVNTSSKYPELSKSSRMSVKFSGNYVKENKPIYSIKSVKNIILFTV